MRRFLIMLIGLGLLAAGAALLWLSIGPQPTESRTTGGVLFTQQELAAQGASPMLGTMTDAPIGGMAAIPMEVELSAPVLQDLAMLEQAEVVESPPTVPMGTMEFAGPPLTTDIMLDSEMAIAVAPVAGAADTPAPDGQGGMGGAATGYEQRVVELEWPAEFQVGRAGLVRVKLKMLAGGALQPVAEIGSNEVLATPILIADRYDDYDALVTASIVAPDFALSSSSPPTQMLQRGGEVEWRWTLESDEAHTSLITLGLAITWQARTPGVPPGPVNVPIWGQALEVEVNHVFGLITVPQASILGTALALLGLLAQYPLLSKIVELLLDSLFSRRSRA